MLQHSLFRREFLRVAGAGSLATAKGPSTPGAQASRVPPPDSNVTTAVSVRAHGALGDGMTLDTTAINQAIETVSQNGGGTVRFPPGTYLSYSIRLRSNIALYLEPGAVLLAASVPVSGRTADAYDLAESNAPWECERRGPVSHQDTQIARVSGLLAAQCTGFPRRGVTQCQRPAYRKRYREEAVKTQ